MTPAARTPKTTPTAAVDSESPSAASSRYQQLRSHLASSNCTPPPRHFPACWIRPPRRACR